MYTYGDELPVDVTQSITVAKPEPHSGLLDYRIDPIPPQFLPKISRF